MNQVFKYGGTVPPPDNSSKETTPWVEVLRWLICVMNDDDKSIGFVSGCLSQCVKNNGLTPRQAAGCQKVWDRVLDDYHHLQLDCQAEMGADLHA